VHLISSGAGFDATKHTQTVINKRGGTAFTVGASLTHCLHSSALIFTAPRQLITKYINNKKLLVN